jgi:hypothetical protein
MLDIHRSGFDLASAKDQPGDHKQNKHRSLHGCDGTTQGEEKPQPVLN